MKKFLFFLLLFSFSINAQKKNSIKWIDPSLSKKNVIEGQAWPGETDNFYDRLPVKSKNKIPPYVWELGTQSAGLVIRFRSNSNEIKVRYQTKNKNYSLNHMPATGSSGIDLYAIDADGKKLWVSSTFGRSFKDTIQYNYTKLIPNDNYNQLGREYRLYLPLYNKVEWMEIGVKNNSNFSLLNARKEKPIVVYGTSIAQGACASRPGMAWASILGRRMDRPIINLGFDGNGKMQSEVVDLISEIESKIFIIDCIPNLTKNDYGWDGIDNEKQFENLIINTIKKIRSKHPHTAILLSEHAGYNDHNIKTSDYRDEFNIPNQIQKKVFMLLKKNGDENLFYLSEKEIGFSIEETVDGIHPSDLGMKVYADAYEKKLRNILKEPIGKFVTTQPVTQLRELGNYDWESKHNEILNLNKSNPPENIIISNSIIHFWGGLPDFKTKIEPESWEKFFTPLGLRNFAYGWDRIENVLWRIYHDELEGFNAKNIIILIGTNNIPLNSDDEIIEGLSLISEAVKARQPKSKISLMGILPKRNFEERIKKLNVKISSLAKKLSLNYEYMGD
ncbi:MAG: acetylhydrolase, partial [Flavobacteriaceae bacterium]|nr:acetylhydrolase [Flavobacteriaceae bacterium]